MIRGSRAGRSQRRGLAVGAAVLALAALVVGIVLQDGRSGPTPQDAAAAASSETTAGTPATVDTSMTNTGGQTARPDSGTSSTASALPAGLRIQAAKALQPAEPVTVVTGKPLDDGRIHDILDRLPPLAADSDLGTPFRWPTQSLTAPRTGTVVDMPFPAENSGTGGPDEPPAQRGPLHVARMQPQGTVAVAPFLSITFDQPMVPVATVGQLAARTVPVTITPKIDGTWSWIGTETLRFAADSTDVDRLPMATNYTVTVPAGTSSATGGKLAAAAIFRFATPPPSIKQLTPSGKSLKVSPVFVALFDQNVDPAEILDKLTLTADGAARPIRLATTAEVRADSAATAAIGTTPEHRIVAFRPTAALPTDAAVEITLAAGAPSAEGPRTTTKAVTFTSRTYAALKLTRTDCRDYSGCQAGGPITLTFNNKLNVKAFDPKSVTVTPAIPGGATITATDQLIMVQGATQPSVTYTVSVAAGLLDVYSQKLAEPAGGTATFGAAEPRLDAFSQVVTTVDPMMDRLTVPVNTVNRKEFRERVFRVNLGDWSRYQSFLLSNANSQTGLGSVPGWPVLLDRTVQIGGPKNQLITTRLDLTSELTGPDATRNVVVLLEPTAAETFSDYDWQNRPTTTWVQATTLGVDALSDDDRLRVWVTDLRSGTPLADTSIAMIDSSGLADEKSKTTTNANGVAAIDLGAGGTAILARRGDQTALLAGSGGGVQWQRSGRVAQYLWFVNDDRQTYRPGETVSVKGWVRHQSADVTAALSTIPAGSTVTYQARDDYGVQLASGKASLSPLGGFDLEVVIPAGANLGTASIDFAIVGGGTQASYSHSFQIADFRTPDFEVDTHGESGLPYVAGTDLTVGADANYYAGGPLGDAPVTWQVRTAVGTYAPPGWGTYTFGLWTPWWQSDVARSGLAYGSPTNQGHSDYGTPCCNDPTDDDAVVKTFSGTTDGNGGDYVKVRVGDLGKDYVGLPVTVTAQATVTDVNRQDIADTTTLLVHPAADYVGLAGDDTFVKQGADMVIRAVATDIDGKATAGLPITVRATKVTTTYRNGESVDTEGSAQTCSLTSTTEPVSCTFHPSVGGTYRITATVTDSSGRTSRSQLTRWVSGPDGASSAAVSQQELTLVPDKEIYRVGDTARVLVQSPIATGTGLATVLHNGIVKTVTFPVADGSAVLALPVTEAELPGVSVSVEVVGTEPRDAASDGNIPRPAYATGDVPLQVSTDSRKLIVKAVPRDTTVAPGGSTKLDVTITDAKGKPVPAGEFEVVVADEAVLALGAQPLPDPLQAFYPQLANYLTATYGRASILLGDPTAGQQGNSSGQTAVSASAAASSEAAAGGMAKSAYGTADSASAAVPAAAPGGGGLTERTNFTPLAVFLPNGRTDESGHATVDIPLPDNLTRYRVMVVAVAGTDAFGSTESTITAGLPLTVRPSGPAFLNFGDTVEFPVLVQNQTDDAMTTDVVVQTANLTVSGPAGQQVSVPAHGRVEVRFAMSAAQAGTARVRVAAVSGAAGDSATIDLPVYTPATTETVATYGVVNGGTAVKQPVTEPEDVFTQFGGLQVSTSSTALQELTDALDYLVDYDYQSSDALASQIIAIASLGDVLQSFSAPGLPSPEKLKALVTDDITALVAMQNDDGGFPYWQKGDDSEPFNSIQATQALVVADKHGFTVNADVLQRADSFLSEINRHIPSTASQTTRDMLRAYALNVRMLAGHRDAKSAESLATERGTALALDAVAWLLPVVADAGVRDALLLRLNNSAVDDAGSVTFTNKVTDDTWTTLQSDRRTDGLVLDALLSVTPDSDMVGKIVNGLLSARISGRWDNVQENSVILLALRHYYDTFESTTPDFVARIWVGGRFAGEHEYQGHTTERATVNVPTDQVISTGAADVTLQNDGTGRLFYRIGLQTAPKSLNLAPVDRGFVVARTYRAVDDPKDVTRDAKGVWHIRAGARVEVNLQLVSRSARSHVALVDPLPAGLQVLNPELATTSKDLAPKAKAAPSGPDWWYGTWFDHQNLRSDRAEAFAAWLAGGVYEYSYLARATTVGAFVAPPARAEQMYAPETFGRGGSDRVVVQD